MSASTLEAFLARIYVDPHARARFLSNPTAEASRAGLSDEEVEAVKQIDQVGLELFAASLERKRQKHCRFVITKRHIEHTNVFVLFVAKKASDRPARSATTEVSSH